MQINVGIVMYHYVREIEKSAYPNIKGLEVSLFKEQVKYLKKHCNIITMEQLIYALDYPRELPKRSILLTFDDGYLDHYKYVGPILDQLQIKGAFFPCAKIVMSHQVLDVNKIHFILAAADGISVLLEEIFKLLNYYRKEYKLESNEFYFKKLAQTSRFDTKEVIFIKRLLQVELEESLRNKITDYLFIKFVNESESRFSQQLYMNEKQLQELYRCGHHIGSHGYDHYWLNVLTKESQEIEIVNSLSFLKQIGIDINNWTMCYPYGAFSKDTIDLLKAYNCKLAFTTEPDVASLMNCDRFKIPRLDTNDLPKQAAADISHWLKKI